MPVWVPSMGYPYGPRLHDARMGPADGLPVWVPPGLPIWAPSTGCLSGSRLWVARLGPSNGMPVWAPLGLPVGVPLPGYPSGSRSVQPTGCPPGPRLGPVRFPSTGCPSGPRLGPADKYARAPCGYPAWAPSWQMRVARSGPVWDPCHMAGWVGLGLGFRLGLGSGVRVGFRVRFRIRVSVGFRAVLGLNFIQGCPVLSHYLIIMLM